MCRKIFLATASLLLTTAPSGAAVTDFRIGPQYALWSDTVETQVDLDANGIANSSTSADLFLYAPIPFMIGYDGADDDLGYLPFVGCVSGDPYTVVVTDSNDADIVTVQIIQYADDGSGSYSACGIISTSGTGTGTSRMHPSECSTVHNAVAVRVKLPPKSGTSPSRFGGLSIHCDTGF